MASLAQSNIHLPRVEIKFCTACKWNLRAAYFAQEILQTFGTSIGEIALVPVTGGIFTVTVSYQASPTDPSEDSVSVEHTVIWDRKTEGGFPETKELKNRVRNIIEPDKDLGHIDRSLQKAKAETPAESISKSESSQTPTITITSTDEVAEKENCEDCK